MAGRPFAARLLYRLTPMAKTKTKTPAKVDPKAKGEMPRPAPKVRKRNQVKKDSHGNMILVLVEDVTHVGKVGDQVAVKPGYARNYLIPNGMAVVPTPHDLRML